jgi:hypothetical protein
MTDLTTFLPISIPQPRLVRIWAGGFSLSAMMGEIARSYSEALRLACLDPFGPVQRGVHSKAFQASEEGSDGRDPSW